MTTVLQTLLFKEGSLKEDDVKQYDVKLQTSILQYPTANFLPSIDKRLEQYVKWLPCILLYNNKDQNVVVYNGEFNNYGTLYHVDSGISVKQWLEKHLGNRKLSTVKKPTFIARDIFTQIFPRPNVRPKVRDDYKDHEKYLDSLLDVVQTPMNIPKFVVVIARRSTTIDSELEKFESSMKNVQTMVISLTEKDLDEPFIGSVVRNIGCYPRILLFKHEDWISKNPKFEMYHPENFQRNNKDMWDSANLCAWYDSAIYLM